MTTNLCHCGAHCWKSLSWAVAICDPQYVPLLDQTWRSKKRGWNQYVVRTENFYVDGVRKNFTAYLHHMILPLPRGYVVDHINRNGLDNRRVNLRVVSCAINSANKRYFAGTSKYRGVSYSQGKIRATLQHNGRQHYLGIFASEEDAARAYDDLAAKLFGGSAILNFSPQEA